MLLLLALSLVCSSAILPLWVGDLKPVQEDFQPDFARMTNEVECFVLLAELWVVLFSSPGRTPEELMHYHRRRCWRRLQFTLKIFKSSYF